MLKLSPIALTLAAALLSACSQAPKQQAPVEQPEKVIEISAKTLLPGNEQRLDIYYPVDLTADLSSLSKKQKQMISLLIDASKIMDDLFWKQAFQLDKTQFLNAIADPKARKFAEINYGPWDRLNGDKPFLSDTEEKPAGAQFYPADMTKEEFEAADIADKQGLYSMVSRNESGELVSTPYTEVSLKACRKRKVF
jgi:hypothetical protein